MMSQGSPVDRTQDWVPESTQNGLALSPCRPATANDSRRKLPFAFLSPPFICPRTGTANPPEKAQQDHPIAMRMLGFTNVTKVNKSPNRVIAASVVVINPSFTGL